MFSRNNTNSLFADLRERMVAIETKLDQFNETRETAHKALAIAERNADDITELKSFAAQNRDNSTAAKQLAEIGKDDICEIKESRKWNFRAVLTVGIPVVIGTIANFVLNLMAG